MKITIESTDKITSLEIRDGSHGISMPARIWEGFTESGIPVHCFITRIAPRSALAVAIAWTEIKAARKAG